jgi:hypothetical protein
MSFALAGEGRGHRHHEAHDGVGQQQDEQGLDEEPAFQGLPQPPPPGVPVARGESDQSCCRESAHADAVAIQLAPRGFGVERAMLC